MNTNHRIMHILNRNIDPIFKYSLDEVKKAFSVEDYNLATDRQQIIFDKFFKECDYEDFIQLAKILNISQQNFKSIYSSSNFLRSLVGVAKVWDEVFDLPHIYTINTSIPTQISEALTKILAQREIN